MSRRFTAEQTAYAVLLSAAGLVVAVRLLVRAWDEAFSDWMVTP